MNDQYQMDRNRLSGDQSQNSRLAFAIVLAISCCFGSSCFDSNKPSARAMDNKDRVEQAIQEKKTFLNQKLIELNIPWDELHLFIRAFKQEQLLEVWAKSKTQKKYQKLIDYDFCTLSGQLGPKRKEGDRQVPEGCYRINRFNPRSNYYLSLGIDYPNRSDRIRGDQEQPGSDIFIHGACVSIGCIPIRDDKIKELYVLARQARENGQKTIAVNIYPAKLTAAKIAVLQQSPFEQHVQFWKELKVIYDQFEKTREVPEVSINNKGAYQLVSVD